MIAFQRRQLLTGLGLGTVALWTSNRAAPWVRAVWADEPSPALPGAAKPQRSPKATADHVIVLWMAGGPSHIDTFDPKPGRETGGPFAAIDTAADGVRISERFPKLAATMRDLTVVRSLTTKQGAHERATVLLQTGYEPEATVVHPHVGSVLAGTLGEPEGDLPAFVSIGACEGPGFLGATVAPFGLTDPARAMDDLKPRSAEAERLARRLAFLEVLERSFPGEPEGPVPAAHRTARDRARRLMQSPKLDAFDIGKEPAKGAEPYGTTPVGRALLLARRLVEAGVRVVHVTMGGWDTHRENFEAVTRLCAALDPAWAALQADLRSRGLLARTTVLWMGEFGRTPTINPNHGRDHHPAAFSAVVGGGGIAGGRVVGSTDEDGRTVKDRPVSVPDLLATVLTAAGVDLTTTYEVNGRPITPLPKDAKPLADLLGG